MVWPNLKVSWSFVIVSDSALLAINERKQRKETMCGGGVTHAWAALRSCTPCHHQLVFVESCKKMAPLIADKIQNIQKKHDELTDLNDSFLVAMGRYQT